MGKARNEDRQHNLETDYFSVHTIMVPFAVTVLVNSVYKFASKHSSRGPPNEHRDTFYQGKLPSIYSESVSRSVLKAHTYSYAEKKMNCLRG